MKIKFTRKTIYIKKNLFIFIDGFSVIGYRKLPNYFVVIFVILLALFFCKNHLISLFLFFSQPFYLAIDYGLIFYKKGLYGIFFTEFFVYIYSLFNTYITTYIDISRIIENNEFSIFLVF